MNRRHHKESRAFPLRPPFRSHLAKGASTRGRRPPASAFLSLVAAGALVFASGSAPALAQAAEPTVEVGPSGVHAVDGATRVGVSHAGVRVDTPGAHVDVRPGSHILVCANGVRVVVHTGQAPVCPQPPPGPELPSPEEPLPEVPAPEEPVPELPAAEEPAPPHRGEAPAAAPAETEPVEAEPVEPERGAAPEEAPADLEPEASPALAESAQAPPEPPEAVREALLPATGATVPAESSSVFTPLRTMVVVAIVAVGAASGAGRAVAALSR